MTDQHQPAAVAPRLSEAEISEIHRQVRSGYHPGATRELLATLDATRDDLARTRAEAAAREVILREALEDAAISYHSLLEHSRIWTGEEFWQCEADSCAMYRAALAAPQPEQQPAAPVAPILSPEEIETKWSVSRSATPNLYRMAKCAEEVLAGRMGVEQFRRLNDLDSPMSAAPVDRSAEASAPLITEAMDALCGCGHERREHQFDEWCSRCDCEWFGPPLAKHATTPPDHQAAGDEP